MPEALEPEALRALHGRIKAVARRLRLPFRRHAWKGAAGNWQGVGIGSSIEFQDHRPYLPGDDPRYIDWQAYARTGHYTMKLYREEVSPRVDIVLDTSSSMSLTPEKRTRTLELLYFAIESGLLGHATLRCATVRGPRLEPVPLEWLLGYRWDLPQGTDPEAAGRPAVERADLRHGSMRVLISDLLFPGAPETALRLLRSRRGRGLVLVPYLAEEESPPWDGNVELLDCERGTRRRQRLMPDIHRRYREAYRRHFALWFEQARKHDVLIARVACEPVFFQSLLRDALRHGAVEMWA